MTWIDVFAEAGYAHIYFGDFGGLSETDVQNDYFGNFGEKEGWTAVPQAQDDKSGRDFKPSENAYTYLRVEAGDGAKESEVNTHFNFNVLEEKDLVNVFDADGYCNASHRKVVLHNNLYGDGEITGDTAKTIPDNLILKPTDVTSHNDTKITKEVLYGNGYQVNLKVLNDKITDDKLNNKLENTGNGTDFGTIYNVKLKGHNDTTEIRPTTTKLLYKIKGIYYSDIQYYSKMNPSGGKIYIKNSILRCVASAALQLYGNNQNSYLENVVMSECLKGISLESGTNQTVNVKGFLDVLNYYYPEKMAEGVGLLNGAGASMAKSFLTTDTLLQYGGADAYMEWFGNKNSDYEGYKQAQSRFVNMVLFAFPSVGKNKPTKYWNGNEYTTAPEEDVKKFEYIELLGMFSVMVYKETADLDGGQKSENSKYYDTRNMQNLFSNQRDIRVLCQYKTIKDGKLEKNTDHILWHMQKVYRDLDLYPVIGNREPDHIKALKKSLINVKWPDGTCANEYIQDALSDKEKAKLDQSLSAGTK